MKKSSKSAIIRNFLRDHPNMSPSLVAKKLGVTVSLVSVCKNELKKKGVAFPILVNTRHTKEATSGTITVSSVLHRNHPVTGKALMSAAAPQQIEMFEPPSDPVNHPAHYKVGGIETIDFIEAKKLNYNLGNVVKYVTRADHKGERRENLEKALWYLKRELGL